MQIHEITHKHLTEYTNMPTAQGTAPMSVNYGAGFAKPAATATATPTASAPVASSGGIGSMAKTAAGGAAAVGGGILGQIGKSLMNKAFGGTDVMGNKTGPGMNRSDALRLGQELSRTLMPVMMKDWATQVQSVLSKSIDPATKMPATSAAVLAPDSKNNLKAQLDAMISQAIQPRGGFDYNKLAQYAGNDTLAKNRAQVVIQKIAAAADQIFKATLDPTSGADMSQAWQSLMTGGIAPAQGIIAFDNSSSSTGGVKVTPGQAATRPTGLPYPDDYEINLGQGWVTRDFNNPQHMAFLRKQAGLA